MKRQLWVGVMTHVVNQSKISCLLYCPAISPLGTVVTKRLNAGFTCNLRGLPLGPGRSLHPVMKAWRVYFHYLEGNIRKVVTCFLDTPVCNSSVPYCNCRVH